MADPGGISDDIGAKSKFLSHSKEWLTFKGSFFMLTISNLSNRSYCSSLFKSTFTINHLCILFHFMIRLKKIVLLLGYAFSINAANRNFVCVPILFEKNDCSYFVVTAVAAISEDIELKIGNLPLESHSEVYNNCYLFYQ